MDTKPSLQTLIGQNEQHIKSYIQGDGSEVSLHEEVLAQFVRLQGLAIANNFEIKIVSGYRSYQRQLVIWNEKILGKREILDKSGKPLDHKKLTQQELVFAILRWSALPGASRHHWGTDMDVIESGSLPAGYKLRLVSEEFTSSGIFGSFNNWLTELIARGESVGFFRPYAEDRGGVCPEPWHLSYAPLAAVYQSLLNAELLKQQIATSDILLKEVVIDHFDEIYARFIQIPAECYPPKQQIPEVDSND